MARITVSDFLSDSQGGKFRDVVEWDELEFSAFLDFFSDETRQIRMEDSERHHDRPALAGVIREFENSEPFREVFAEGEERYLRRLRQAIGVLVRLIMESRGWKKKGCKGSLGQSKMKDIDHIDGRLHNTSGLSWWFKRVERYFDPEVDPFPSVGDELPDELAPAFSVAQRNRED